MGRKKNGEKEPSLNEEPAAPKKERPRIHFRLKRRPGNHPEDKAFQIESTRTGEWNPGIRGINLAMAKKEMKRLEDNGLPIEHNDLY